MVQVQDRTVQNQKVHFVKSNLDSIPSAKTFVFAFDAWKGLANFHIGIAVKNSPPFSEKVKNKPFVSNS